MSSNNTHSGMVTQIFTSTPPPHYSNNFANISNYAVDTKILPFLNDGNICVLNLSANIDCYIPHTLVIHLYSNPNIQDPNYIHNICNLFHTMRLVLQISEQTVLQLPLSLLCKIKTAEIHDEKLYIHIPFKSLFEKINMIELLYSTVSFSLVGTHEISNYANNFSLITKIYLYDANERTWASNNRHNINRLIQQINTIYISNNNYSNDNSPSRRIFQIQTNMLNGVTKGLLIQCSLTNLLSIKFYLNNLLRFHYDPYLISSACIKLSNNLLYMPFNDETDFLNRDIDSFSGSINLSRLQNSTLCLQFDQDQDHVVIHNVYLNYHRQNSGLSGLGIDYRPTFTQNTTSDHPIQPIVGIPPNSDMLDMSGNYIINTPNMRDMSGNYIINNPSHGRTGSNYHNTGFTSSTGSSGSSGSSATTGTSGDAGPPSSIQIHYPIPNGAIIHQPINPERNICNITHDEIAVNQRYMSCSNCQIHFLETALKQWFSPRLPGTRTCPICREVWTNFNVYINHRNNSELD